MVVNSFIAPCSQTRGYLTSSHRKAQDSPLADISINSCLHEHAVNFYLPTASDYNVTFSAGSGK